MNQLSLEYHAKRIVDAYKMEGVWAENNFADPPAPTANESTSQMMEAFIKHFPDYIQSQANALPIMENEMLRMAKTTSPEMAKIQLGQFQELAPQFNAIGEQINQQSAEAQALSDLGVISGTGRKLVEAARDTQRIIDPEVYKVREIAGNQLTSLLGSYDPTGLSGSERSEIERGLNRSITGRGNMGSGSMIETLNAANTYGQALQSKQNQLSTALQTASGFLQTAGSGVDSFQVATGKPSRTNQGQGLGTNVSPTLGADAVFGAAGGLTSQIGQFTTQANQINSERRDIVDRMTGIMGSLPNIT